MVAAIRTKAGAGKCLVCGERVVWRKTAGGALSCFCGDCDFQGYAKHGTQAELMILASIGAGATEPKPEPAPAPAPKPAAPAKAKEQTPAPKPGIFGGLIG